MTADGWRRRQSFIIFALSGAPRHNRIWITHG
jgi:hypothetical protein